MVAALVAAHRPSPRDTAAAVAATAWSGTGVLGLNLLAFRADWWSFHSEGPSVLGVPVELWWGWAVLWGVLPVLLARDLPVPLVVGAIVWLDLILMPLAAPVVRLAPGWPVGEAVGVVLCLLPAVLLGQRIRQGRHLALRERAQAALPGIASLARSAAGALGARPGGPRPRTGPGSDAANAGDTADPAR